MRLETSRIPELDGLRGIAIALVIAFHGVLAAPVASESLERIMLFGWSGVDLFFVLSGFLIGGILIDSHNSEQYYVPFYARRFFRIVPIYFVVICVYAAIWFAGGGPRADLIENAGPPMPWLTYFSFTNNLWIARHDSMNVFLSVSWSLAIEEQFYLTLPFLMRRLNPRRMYVLVPLGILSVAILRSVVCSTGMVTQNQAYVLPWLRADALGVGVLCALLVRNETVVDFLRRRAWVLYVAIGVFGTIIVATGGALPPREASPDTPLMTFGLTVVALFYASVMLLAILHAKHWGMGLFRARPLRLMGKLSYFIYLAHFTLITATMLWVSQYTSSALAKWLALAAAMALVIGVAQISWVAFESKMVRVGHRFKYKSRVANAITEPVAVEDEAAA